MFKGIYTALVTPFTSDLKEIDYQKFAKLIEFQINSNVDGIVIAGTTGEGSSLSDQEFENLLKHSQKYTNQIKLVANIGSNNFEHVKKRLELSNKYQLDGVLVVPPYYSRTNQNGLYKLYEYVAQNSNAPVIIYEIPGRVGMSIELSQVEQLAKNSNIKAIKIANDNSAYISQIGQYASDNFTLLGGNDDLFLLTLISRGSGIITAFGNVKPEYFVKTYQLFNEGKITEAMNYFYTILPAIKAAYQENNPILVKELTNKLVLPVGECRMPLGKANAQLVEQAIKEIEKCV